MSKTLGDIISNIDCAHDASLNQSTIISHLSCDSRDVKPGTLFFAIKGAKFDSHQAIPEVLAKGAVCIVSEDEAACKSLSNSYLIVPNIRRAIADFAAEYYDNPSKSYLTIGITGTNGKTSVSWIITELLKKLDIQSSHIGTLGFRSSLGEQLIKTENTSPEPLALYSFLQKEREKGAKAFVLEATSQAVVQERLRNLAWDLMLFTNLSRDHLDLHSTYQAYGEAKKRLFTEELPKSTKSPKIAVLNLDDSFATELLSDLKKNYPALSLFTFSSKSRFADVFLKSAELSAGGSVYRMNIAGKELTINSQLIGSYNVSNALASVTALHALGFDLSQIAKTFPNVRAVPGRLELVAKSEVSAFVDYAHTPDALIAAQESLRELKPKRLITVFGCGGDRDRGKRPLMGSAVLAGSDYAILTSDNPRSEDPLAIIDDVLPAFVDARIAKEVIPDRQKAISRAIQIAEPGDFILVAGKGHEDYQEIKGIKHHFDDREICLAALKEQGLV